MNRSRSRRVGRLIAVAGLFAALVPARISATPAIEQEDTSPSAASWEVTDMRGRTVTVPAEVNRIIALGANSLRLITYLDSVDKVVAVEDTGHAREKTLHDFFFLATYRVAYPSLRDLPSIGSAENHEAIIAASPDIVMSSTVDVAALDQLQNTLGIPVFAIDADVEVDDTERFLEQIRVVGRVLGKEARASRLILAVEAILGDLSARALRVTQPKSAYAGGMMYYGPADLLRTTGDYVPFDFTSTVNVMPTSPAGNRQPYMTSIEQLVSADPHFVFVDAANEALSRNGYLDNRKVLDEHVTAFASRDVYTTLVYKYYGTNWENQLINVYLVGSILYPELFSDVTVRDKAEEIWRLFFGVDVDYDTVVALHGPGVGRANWW